jgi:hypothetical protein
VLSGADSTYVMATYAPRGNPDGYSYGEGTVPQTVSAGQTVVVRYDAHHPTNGTVLAQSTPHGRPNGLYGVFVLIVGLGAYATLYLGHLNRWWRRIQAREDATDYRKDPWAGTTYSA